MAVHINGIIVGVDRIVDIQTQKGTIIRKQSCLIQHDFSQQYPKYLLFEIVGDNIQRFGVRQNEELELSLDLSAFQGRDGQWYNSTPRCFAIERDKEKWHNAKPRRIATVPVFGDAAQQPGQPVQPSFQQPQQAYAGNAPYAAGCVNDLPFPPEYR